MENSSIDTFFSLHQVIKNGGARKSHEKRCPLNSSTEPSSVVSSAPKSAEVGSRYLGDAEPGSVSSSSHPSSTLLELTPTVEPSNPSSAFSSGSESVGLSNSDPYSCSVGCGRVRTLFIQI